MPRTSPRTVLAVALLGVPLALGAPSAGAADAAPEAGWWTAADPAAPAPAPAPPPGSASAPDVPPDGLLVQGGADAPTAYAALAFPLAQGVRAGRLTLRQAGGSVSTPTGTLQACPLESPTFTPAQGGPIADAPAYDCGRSVTATLSGSDYSFDVAELAQAGALAVALVPASPDVRVVLAKPQAGSLSTSGSPSFAPADEGPGQAVVGVAVAQPPSLSDGVGAALAVAQPPSLSDDVGAAPAVAPAPAVDGGVAEDTPPGSLPVALATPDRVTGAGRVLGVLLAGAAALALGLWAFVGTAAAPAGAPVLPAPEPLETIP